MTSNLIFFEVFAIMKCSKISGSKNDRFEKSRGTVWRGVVLDGRPHAPPPPSAPRARIASSRAASCTAQRGDDVIIERG
jgi:hypothetical protein